MNTLKGYANLSRLAKVISFNVIITLVFAIFGQIYLPKERETVSEGDILYKNSFIWVKDDGTTEEIAPGVKVDVPSGQELIVETILPEGITETDTFWINSCHQSVRMYVKKAEEYGNSDYGTLIMEYDTSGHWYSGNNSPSKFVKLYMDPTMSGKVLRITLTSRSIFSGSFYDAYMGSSSDVTGVISSERTVALAMSLTLLIVGFVIIIACEFVGRMLRQSFVITMFLGTSCLCTGLWILFETRFRQFIFSNISLISNLAYPLMALMGATIILYMDYIMEGRHKRMLHASIWLLTVLEITCVILHFIGIADFTETMLVSYVAPPYAVSQIIVVLIRDFIDKKIQKYKMAIVGFFCLCVMALYELILDLTEHNENTGVYIGAGMLIYALMAIFNTFFVLMEEEKIKDRAVIEGKAKSQFLANMSHEIRTPINSVLGMNEMILRESQEPETLEYASHIESSGRLLLSIVNEILDFSKIEAGKMDICPVEYRLSSVLNDLMNTLTPKANEKGLKFEVCVDETIPDKLKGDEIRIRQIVINLVNNAIKYTHQGSVSLVVKGIYDIPGSLNLVIEVKDTGTGIKEEDIQKLFEAFKRVDEENNRHIEGTGLGLSITESLIELMGGSISVSSKYGYGSTFVVQIPQAIVDREPIGDLKKRAGLAQDSMKKYKESFIAPGASVLVVDDNPSNLTVVKLLLKKTAMIVDTVDSGAKALEMLKIRNYDIVMLDHMMPEMDGIETLRCIKEAYPDKTFPVIALTANAISGAKEEYLAAGFEDYMSKPILGDALEKMILTWLPKDKIKSKSETEVPVIQTGAPAIVITDVTEDNSDTISEKSEISADSQSELPHIDRIDWEAAMEYLPDMDILMETLISVTKGMPSLAEDVERYFDELRDENNEESMSNYRIKVHAMKGSAKMIGANALSEEARLLEFAAKDGEYDKIMMGTTHLLMEWRALHRDLAQFLKLDQ